MRVAVFERKFSEVDGASDLIAALKALRHPKSEFFRSLLNDLAGFGVGAEGLPLRLCSGQAPAWTAEAAVPTETGSWSG